MGSEHTPLFEQICNGYPMGKEELVDELIAAWKEDRRWASAVHRAAIVPNSVVLSREQWRSLMLRAHELLPCFPADNSSRMGVRVLVSQWAGNVSDMLWDGQFDRARKTLLAGNGKRTRLNIDSPRAEPRKAVRDVEQGTIVVKARSLTKAHDWKTVK